MTERERNQGEGDKESDRRFREEQAKFVKSSEGKRKIAEAGKVSDEEAPQAARKRRKSQGSREEEDPVIRNQTGGSGPSKPN